MKKKKLPHGEIFAVPLPGGAFLHGRILLDINGTLKRRLFPEDASLTALGRAYLVEMYSVVRSSIGYKPSAVLIPGAIVDAKEANEIWADWSIVGHNAVDPKKIEFPETLIGFQHPQGEIAYECGEIRIPLPLKRNQLSAINQYSARHSAFLWPFVCLWELGRRTDVPKEYKTARIDGTDLRISPYRNQVYAYLPFKMETSYFEKQKTLGLQFERLYEHD